MCARRWPRWALALLGVLAMIALLLFQGVIEDPRMEAQTLNFAGRSIQNGAAIFANNCSSCHGPDGKGLPGVAPALHSKYFFTSASRIWASPARSMTMSS